MTITAVGAQEGGVTSDSVTTSVRAFPGNVTAGNMIVVGCCKDGGGTAFVAGSCTKSAGTATIGAITLDSSVDFDLGGGVGNRRVGIWSCLVTGTGSCTMTVTGAVGNYWVMGSGEYASDVGWDASRVEATNSGTNATDDTLAASAGSLTAAGKALLFGAVVSESTGAGVTFAADAAFTSIYKEENGSSHLVGSIIRRILASGATDAPEWTVGTSNAGYAAAGVAYKEVVAAGGANPKGPLGMMIFGPMQRVVGP